MKKIAALAAAAATGVAGTALLWSLHRTVNAVPPLIELKNGVVVTGSITGDVVTKVDVHENLEYTFNRGLELNAAFELAKPVTGNKRIEVGWVQALTKSVNWGEYEDRCCRKNQGDGVPNEDPSEDRFSGGRVIHGYPDDAIIPDSTANFIPWSGGDSVELLHPGKTKYSIPTLDKPSGFFPLVDPYPETVRPYPYQDIRLVKIHDRKEFTNYLIAMDEDTKVIQQLWELNWQFQTDIEVTYDVDEEKLVLPPVCRCEIDGLESPTKGPLDVKDVVFKKGSTEFFKVEDVANYAYKSKWVGDNGKERVIPTPPPIPVGPPKPLSP